MSDTTTLMQFPCDFPVKIIGENSNDFVQDIHRIILSHFSETADDKIIHKSSAQDNYISITATVHALEQASLDAMYEELSRHPKIKMVL